MTILFKLSIVTDDVFSQFYGQKLPPLYCIAENPETAISIASKNLNKEFTIRRVVQLGVACSPVVFAGVTKTTKKVTSCKNTF